MESYVAGTSVTLTASPPAGYLVTWSGNGCSGTGTTCTVVMNQTRSVTATFSRPVLTVNWFTTYGGSGKLTSSPVGISCGSTCSSPFNKGTSVTLTATPTPDSIFDGWISGTGCSGTNPVCTVVVNSSFTVEGKFRQPLLTIGVNNTTKGKITGTVEGNSVNLPNGTTNFYTTNVSVGATATLTATANPGYTFTGWTGACTGTGTCSITMPAGDLPVTANFQ